MSALSQCSYSKQENQQLTKQFLDLWVQPSSIAIQQDFLYDSLHRYFPCRVKSFKVFYTVILCMLFPLVIISNFAKLSSILQGAIKFNFNWYKHYNCNHCEAPQRVTQESKLKQDLGLKCSAKKVFGSKDFGLVGLYQKAKQNFVWVKKILVWKVFESKKILGKKKVLFRKNVCPNEIFW